jgi:hypothetical protein
MANNLMLWAAIGKPNQREWIPGEWGKKSYENNDGLYPAGYALFEGRPSESLRAVVAANERGRLSGKHVHTRPEKKGPDLQPDQLWRGQITPATDSDRWLVAGGAAYYHALASTRPNEMEALRAGYSYAAATGGETPLRSIKPDLRSQEWAAMTETKGALLLDALRQRLGDDKFFELMRSFYQQHAGKTASSAEFQQAAEQAAGHPVGDFFSQWLDQTGLPGGLSNSRVPSLIGESLDSALIVYGTVREAGSNRYAAEQIQQKFMNWLEHEIPVRKDFEVTDADLMSHDVIFVGRPETNSALAAWKAKLGIEYEGAAFHIDNESYPSEYDGLVVAGANPLDPKRLAIVLAGNTALQTVKMVNSFPPRGAEFTVYEDSREIASGFKSQRQAQQ